MGTQQLLLDVYNLKTLMLKVPSLGGSLGILVVPQIFERSAGS